MLDSLVKIIVLMHLSPSTTAAALSTLTFVGFAVGALEGLEEVG
jgi:hypothetical protein